MAVSNETRLVGGEQLPRKPAPAAGTEFSAALNAARAKATLPRPSAGRAGSPAKDKPETSRDPLGGREGLSDEKLYGFKVRSGFGGVTIEGQNGDDEITVEATPLVAGRVRVRARAGLVAYELEAGDRRLTIRGRGGDDRIKVAVSLDRPVTIDGGAGNDVIEGGKGNERLLGGSGNDRIEGGGGDDMIYGQSGDDVLHGQDGDDIIKGGGGRDYLDGGDGEDRLRGGRGNDVVSGGNGRDTIVGGRGDDVILSSGGHDAVADGSGANTVYTEDNEDVYINEESSRVHITVTARIVAFSTMIYGDDRFYKSTKSDLEAINSVPGLTSGDASGHGTPIMPTDKPQS